MFHKEIGCFYSWGKFHQVKCTALEKLFTVVRITLLPPDDGRHCDIKQGAMRFGSGTENASWSLRGFSVGRDRAGSDKLPGVSSHSRRAKMLLQQSDNNRGSSHPWRNAPSGTKIWPYRDHRLFLLNLMDHPFILLLGNPNYTAW